MFKNNLQARKHEIIDHQAINLRNEFGNEGPDWVI